MSREFVQDPEAEAMVLLPRGDYVFALARHAVAEAYRQVLRKSRSGAVRRRGGRLCVSVSGSSSTGRWARITEAAGLSSGCLAAAIRAL